MSTDKEAAIAAIDLWNDAMWHLFSVEAEMMALRREQAGVMAQAMRGLADGTPVPVDTEMVTLTRYVRANELTAETRRADDHQRRCLMHARRLLVELHSGSGEQDK